MHAENGIVINEIIKRALEQGRTAPKYHALTRPTIAEAEGVHRAIAIAEMAESPVYIVHLSCADALNQVRQARDRGIPAFAETCPQYLFLSLDNYDEPGFDGAKYVMTPPLRDKSNQAELWKGLKMDDLQVISTDHCPFCMKEQKELGKDDFTLIPNGAPGLEERPAVLWTHGVRGGRISENLMVAVLSTNQAKIHGMAGRKGTIAPGADADVVIWDPDLTITATQANRHGNVDYTPYEGMTFNGGAAKVFRRGELAYADGEVLAPAGSGQFIPRTFARPAPGAAVR